MHNITESRLFVEGLSPGLITGIRVCYIRLLLFLIFIFKGNIIWAQPFNTGTITLDGAAPESAYVTSGAYSMAWDDTYLYVRYSGGNSDEPVIFHVDVDPQNPVDGGTNSNGSLTGPANWGITPTLPFRSDFMIYWEANYAEYRTDDGAGGWSGTTAIATPGDRSNTGTAAREIRLAWTWMGLGGRPSAFNYTGFANSRATPGFIFNQTPSENPGGSLATPVLNYYWTISSTANNANITQPFNRKSFESRAAFTLGTANTFWDFTLNGGTLTNTANHTINNQLYVVSGTLTQTGARTLTFGSSSTHTPTLRCDGTINPNNGAGNDLICTFAQGTTTLSGTATDANFRLFDVNVSSGATLQAPASGTVTLGLQFGTMTVNGTGIVNFRNGSGAVNVSIVSNGTNNYNFSNTGGTATFNNLTCAALASTFRPVSSGTHNLNIAGNLVNTPGPYSTTNGTGILHTTFNGNSAQAISTSVTFQNLTISNTSATVTQSGGTLAIASGRTFYIAPSARFDIGNSAMTITGASVSVDGFFRRGGAIGAAAITGGSAANFFFNNGGTYEHNYTIVGGTVPTATWSTGSTCAFIGFTSNTTNPSGLGQSFYNVTYNCSSQTSSLNFTGGMKTITGTFRVISTGSGSFRVTGATAGPFDFANYIQDAGDVRLVTSSSVGPFNFSSSFTLNGGTFDINSGGSGTQVINFGGNWSQTGGTFQRTSSGAATITFNKASGTQTISQSAGTIASANNWTVGTGSSTNTLQFTSNVNFGTSSTNSLVVANNASVDFQTFTLSGSGAFTANTGSTLISANSSGINSAGGSGSVTLTGTKTFTNTGVNYVFNGSANAVNTGTAISAATSINNLTFNNTFGTAPQITLGASATVAGTLTLTNGIVQMGAHNLTVSGTTSGSVSGGSSTAFLRTNSTGQLRRAIATGGLPITYNFPVGSSTNYTPASFSISANSTARNLHVQAVGSRNSNDVTATDYINNRYWVTDLSDATGTYSYTSAFTFISGDVVGTIGNIRLNRFGGVSWTEDAGSSASGTTLSSGSLTQATGSLSATAEWAGRVNPPSATFVWDGSSSSDWGTAANWDQNAVPSSAADVIVIPDAASYTNALAITGTRSCSDFTVNANGTFSMAASSTLTINGNFTYSSSTAASFDCSSTLNIASASVQTIPAFQYGNLNASGGDRTLASSGTIGICGTFTRGAGTYTVAGSTVDFNGTGIQTISPGIYNNLTVSNNRGSATLTSPSGTISVGGLFDVSTLSNYTASVNATSVFDFTSAGTQDIPAFFYGQINNTGNGNRTWASSGIIDIAQNFSPGSGIHTITGSTVRFSNSGGTFNLVIFSSNVAGRQYNNLIFNGSGSTWSIGGTTLGVAGNLNITAGTFLLGSGSGSGTLNVDGNLTLDGGILNMSNTNASVGTLNLFGDLFLSSGTFNKSNGTAVGNFNFARSSGNQNITQTSATVTNNGTTWNVGTSLTNNTVLLLSNLACSGGLFQVNVNALMDFQGFSLSGTTNFFANTTSTLISSNTNATGAFTTSGANGSVQTTGSRTYASGLNFIFNGSANQVTGNGVGSNPVANLEINTSSGATVTLSNAATITNQLVLTSGILILNSADLTLFPAATIQGSPFSTSKMVVTTGSSRYVGRLLKLFATGTQSVSFTWPLGDNTGTTEYSPVTVNLSYTGAASNPYIAYKVKDGKHPLDPSLNDYLTRYWEITSGTWTGTSSVSLTPTFTYTSADVVGTEALLKLNRVDLSGVGAGTWYEDAGSSAGSNILNGVALTSTTDFDDFDITARLAVPLYFRSNAASGTFESGSSWLVSTDINFVSPPGVAPSAPPTYSNSDDIKILSGHNISISSAAGVDQMTIESGGTLTIGTGASLSVFNGTGTDLQVDGSLVSQSTVAPTILGTLVFSSTGLYNHNVNGGTVPTATWNTGSECRITGITTTAPSGLTGQSFSDFTWNCPSMSSSLNLSGNLTSVTRDLNLVSTNLSTLGFTATSAMTLTVGRDINASGGFYTVCTGANTNATTLNVAGDLNLTGSASFGLTGTGATGTPAVNMNVSGNVNNGSTSGTSLSVAVNSKGATLTVTGNFFKTGSGTMSLVQGTGAGSIAVNGSTVTLSNGFVLFNNGGSGTASFNHANASGTFTLGGGQITMIQTSTAPSNRPTLTIAGDFVQTAGNYEVSTAYIGSLNPPTELLIGGDFTRSGTGYIRSTSPTNNARITFNGTSVYNTTGATGNFTYHNITVNNGNSLTLASDLTFTQATATPSQTLTVNGTLNCGTQIVSQAAAGATFILNTTGTLSLGSPDGITTSGATGNIQTSTRTYNAGTYVFAGSVNQVTGNGLPATVAALTISNSGTAPTNVVSLTGAVTSTGAVTFNSGMLDLGVQNLTAGSVTGASSSRFVRTSSTGQLRQIVASSDVVFPVGNSAYNPFTLNNSGTSDTYGVRALDVITSPAPNDPNLLINRYWVVTEAVAGGSNLAVDAHYNSGEEGINYGSGAVLKMGLFPVSSWVETGASSAGSGPFVVSSSTNFTAVGTFGIGKDNGFINPVTTYTWTGNVDATWSNPNNWNPNTSVAGPLVGDNIIINAPGSVANLNITGAQTIGDVTFNGTGVLNLASGGSLTINGIVTYGGSFTAGLNCNSTITYNNPASLTIPPFDYGNLVNANSSVRTWQAGATTRICGSLTTGSGSSFTAGAGSTVEYNGTGSQTINALNYDNLTISNNRGGATLTLESGTIDVSGNFSPTVSNYMSSYSGNTINFSGSAGQVIPAFQYNIITSANNSRTWASSGVIDVNQSFSPGTGTQTITGSTVRYSNTSAGTFTLSSLTTNVAGRQYNNLEFVGGASTVWQPATAFNFGVAGNLTLSGAGRLIANPNSSIVTWTVDGSLNLTGTGNITLSNSTGTTNFNVAGNGTISSGSLTIVGASTGAGLTTSFSIGDLNISGTGSMNLDAASNTAAASVTVNGNLNVTSTSTNAINLGSGTANANNVVNLKGNLTKSGTGNLGLSGTYNATALYNFNGTGTQIWNHTGAAMTGGGITVTSGSTLQLATNLVSSSSSNANPITIAGTLDCQGFSVSASNSTNTFAISATGTLKTSSASGVGGSVSGFTPNPFFASGATFEFNGTSVNTGFSGFTGITLSNQYVLTWAGNTSLTLDKSVNLSVFNFSNSGLVYLGNFDINLPSGAGALTGTGFGTGKMFVTNGTGSLIRAVLSSGTGLPFTWPIGEVTGTTEYSPVTVNSIASAGISGTLGFRVVDGVHPNMALATSYLSRYWPVTITGFNNTYTLSNLTFTYDPGDIVVGPEGSLRGNSYTGSNGNWTEYASSSAGSNVLTISSGAGGANLPTGSSYDITGRIEVPVYYRSVASTDWTTLTTWEISSDPAFISPAPSTPLFAPNAANAEGITIQAHTVPVTSVLAPVDEVTVNAGGTLQVASGGLLTLANGTGTDLSVDGTLQGNVAYSAGVSGIVVTSGAAMVVNGTFQETANSTNLTGTITIGTTGTYDHAYNGGIVPTCTWSSGATCLISGIIGTSVTNLSQAFHHFTWNCPSQTANVAMNGTPGTVNGNLTFISTGTGSTRYNASTPASPTLNIAGNLDLQGGTFDLVSGTSTPTFNITGNLTQSGGNLTRTGTGTATVNVTGNYTLSTGNHDLCGTGGGGGTTTLNLRGDFNQSGGALFRTVTSSGTATVNFNKTTGIQTWTQSAGTISNNINFNVSGTSNVVQLASNIGLSSVAAQSYTVTVNNGTTLDFGPYILSGGTAGTFTSQSGATLRLGNANGITTNPTLSGSVQLTAARNFNQGTNYVYNGTTDQVTGNGLPSTLTAGQLTIANTGSPGSNTVTLTTNGTTVTTLNLSSGIFRIGSGQTLNISNAGVLNATGGNFATGADGGLVDFAGTGTWNGNSNPYNVEISAGVNFGAQTVTIQNGGTLTIQPGGFVNTNAPAYASGSTLLYNTGGNYDRGVEWSTSTGKGYPHHVTLSNSTTLNPARTGASYAAVPFRCGGDLTISLLSNIYMDFGGNNMTEDLRVLGNLNLQGNLSGSGTAFSDIFVSGDWNNLGSGINFFPNGREVVLNGSIPQTLGGTNPFLEFDYLAISNTSGDVTLNQNLEINTRLRLTSGKLILGSRNATLKNTANSMTTGDQNTYMVTNGIGVFAQTVANDGLDRWCPVGPSTSVYAPVTLNQQAGGTTDILEVRVSSAPAFTNPVEDNNQMVNLEWLINEQSAGGNSLRTTFGWQSGSEATGFDRATAVYHGNWNGSKYVVRATNATSGSDPYYSLSTLAQSYTSTLANQRFVVGNINGILPCLQTASSGDWNTASNWIDLQVPPTGSTVCINHAMTLATSPPNPSGMTLNPGGSVSINNGVTLTFESPGFITNSSGSFLDMTSGTISFSGLGVINGAHAIGFQNLEINGNTTLTTTPTINNQLEIKSGGFIISGTGPNYGSSSTLIYNTSGSYGRSNEWNATSGPGFPAHVLVKNGTTLDISNGSNTARAIAGNLTVDLGGSATMSAMTGNLTIPGNLTLNGSFTQSSNIGGDVALGGNWSSGASAVLNSNNRDVRFDGTTAQTISTASSIVFGFLTIDNSAAAVDLLNTITAGTFRVNPSRTFNLTTDKIIISAGGNVLINGTFNANSGTIEYTDGGNFTNNGTFNRGTSTIDFIGPSAGTVVGTVQTNFHNIRLAPSSGIDFGSGALRGKVSGTFQLRAGSYVASNAPIYEPGSKLMYSGGGTFNRNVEWDASTVQKVEVTNSTTLKCGTNGTSFTHALADSLIIQSGSAFDMSGPDMTSPTQVGGNLLLNGTLILSGTAGGDLEIAGDWVNNGGTFTCNERLVTFNGSLDAGIKGSSNTSFCFLTVNKGIGYTLTAQVPFTVSRPPAGTTVQISGGVFDLNGQSFTLGAGSNTLRIDAGFSNGQTLRTGGTSITSFSNFRSTGANTDTLGGKVDYSGTGSETLITPVKGYNLLWLTGGSTKSISQNTRVSDSLWIAPSTTLDFGAGADVLESHGHVVNNGTTTGSGTGKIELAGSSTQNISGNGTYRNLDVNNSNGVNSSGKPTISSKLNVVLGKLNTGSDTILLGSSATLTETIGGGEHFVRGNIKTSRVVGTSAETFGGMGVTLTAGSDLGTVTVNRHSGTALSGEASCCAGFNSVLRNWTITPTIQPVSEDRTLTLSWPSQDDNGMDLTGIQLWKRTNTLALWEDLDYFQDVSATNPRTMTWASVTGFSQFTGADLNNPLPLGFIRFNGRNEKGLGKLTWVMANEQDILSYRVEKSRDGRNFSEIGSLLPSGSKAFEIEYAFTDQKLDRDSYYRIRMVHEGGKDEFSNVVLIRSGFNVKPEFRLFPNPTAKGAQILVDGSVDLTERVEVLILGTDGRQLSRLSGNLPLVNQEFDKEVSGLPAGVYQIQVLTSEDSKTLRLLRQ